MGVHVIAVYRPKPGADEALLAEVERHVPLLRSLGLATATPSLVLRAPDGTLLEHFEWVSHDAIDTAHGHPEVLAMWERYEACCDYGNLAQLSNAEAPFPEFDCVGTF